jgi:limonene 1,2-monooxygenase
MPFHLSESREQAIRDVEEGILAWNNDYYVDTLGAPGRAAARNGREMVEWLISFGGIIGTPDDALAGIQRLQDLSGGFGCLLGLAHEWADRTKTLRSFELMARYVMPQVQDTVRWTERTREWTSQTKAELMEGANTAILKAIEDHDTEHPRIDRKDATSDKPPFKDI